MTQIICNLTLIADINLSPGLFWEIKRTKCLACLSTIYECRVCYEGGDCSCCRLYKHFCFYTRVLGECEEFKDLKARQVL